MLSMNIEIDFLNTELPGDITSVDVFCYVRAYLECRNRHYCCRYRRWVSLQSLYGFNKSFVDDEGAQQPHSFKSSSFSIPTQCGYCKVLFFLFCDPLTDSPFRRRSGD